PPLPNLRFLTSASEPTLSAQVREKSVYFFPLIFFCLLFSFNGLHTTGEFLSRPGLNPQSLFFCVTIREKSLFPAHFFPYFFTLRGNFYPPQPEV
ncbi:MAG TPA: hypothetical protein DCK81_00480, partial [Clostridiales bacterium UBA9856]|nr:hypothetical protein [Clostridiales bacterium UBA9856]